MVGEIRSVMGLRRLENKDGIRQMMAIFSIRQISSKIQVMPISYRMATTSTIFQKAIYHQVSWLLPKPFGLEKWAEQEVKPNRFMEVEGVKRISRYRGAIFLVY